MLPYATVNGKPNGRLQGALRRLGRGFDGVAAVAVQQQSVEGVMAVDASGTVVVALVRHAGLGLGRELWEALLPRLHGRIMVAEPFCLASAGGFWARMGFESATVDSRLGMAASVVDGLVVTSIGPVSQRLRTR